MWQHDDFDLYLRSHWTKPRLLTCVWVYVHERVYSFIYPQMHTRCLTAVDLAEHVAIQIQFWSLTVKATSHTGLMWTFPPLQYYMRIMLKKAVLWKFV